MFLNGMFLKDGDVYIVKVISCNGVGFCMIVILDIFLIDFIFFFLGGFMNIMIWINVGNEIRV